MLTNKIIIVWYIYKFLRAISKLTVLYLIYWSKVTKIQKKKIPVCYKLGSLRKHFRRAPRETPEKSLSYALRALPIEYMGKLTLYGSAALKKLLGGTCTDTETQMY